MDLEQQAGSTAVSSSLLDVIHIQNRTIAELQKIIEGHRQFLTVLAQQLGEASARCDESESAARSSRVPLNGDCQDYQPNASGREIISILEKPQRPLRASQIAARLHRQLTPQLRREIRRLVRTGMLTELTIARYHVLRANGA